MGWKIRFVDICFQGLAFQSIQKYRFTNTHPRWTLSAGGELFDIFVSKGGRLASANLIRTDACECPPLAHKLIQNGLKIKTIKNQTFFNFPIDKHA